MKYIALLLLSTGLLYSEEPVVLSEKDLIKLAGQETPSIQLIEASYLSSKAEYSKTSDQYSTTLSAESYLEDSKEKSLSNFMPVTSKYQSNKISISRPFQHGVNLGANIFTEKSTNNFLRNATTTGYGASLSINLYKDLFGKVAKANLERNHIGSKRALLESKMQKNTFISNIRKIYWALVANEESRKVTKELLRSSTNQLKLSKQRLRSKVADQGEVARYQAQVASRRSQITSLNYQRADLVRQLKEFIPDLADKKIELADYNVDNTIRDVLICTDMIAKFKEAPLEFTKYDEIVEFLVKEDREQKKITDSYAGMDINLTGEYKSTGKDFSSGQAFRDLRNDGRESYGIGINVSIPLGAKKKTTEEVYRMVEKKLTTAKINENLGRVKAYHSQTVESISNLKEVVKNLEENSKYLGKSLAVSKKKYSQARLTAQQLVQDQDSFFQSSLDEISSRLVVINTLLDYLAIYGDTPCEINRIK